jgi:hypothetical protein
MLNDGEISGFKRIVGSFTEASAFAYAMLGLFGFTAKLWLCGIYPRLTAAVAGLSVCALIFATSSTGYVGLSLFVFAQYLSAVLQILSRNASKTIMIFAGLGPLLLAILGLAAYLDETTWSIFYDLLNKTIFEKLSTDSGVERTAWNKQALTNFFDTFGLGAGIGSVRASSFPIAVLSNIGIFGAVTYGLFIAIVLFRPVQRGSSHFTVSVQRAARAACFAQLIGSFIAGSFIDVGLPFFAFAGFAAGLSHFSPAPALNPATRLQLVKDERDLENTLRPAPARPISGSFS